jgi:phosphoenolpyruvate carboxykinase (GTP)
MSGNRKADEWVSRAEGLCKPAKTVWINGEGLDELREKAVASGELIRLNGELLPNCFLHRSALNDVARSEDKTFVCTLAREDAGPNNNWSDPREMRARMEKLYDGCMRGRTMYVIPFCMGPPGSPFAKLGIEITDSIYVVLNMSIMTRVSPEVSKMLERADDFIECLHSTGTLSEEDRLVCHFPESGAIWSVNSGYGGNALLGKKCLALRIASWQARREGWLAEHTLAAKPTSLC